MKNIPLILPDAKGRRRRVGFYFPAAGFGICPDPDAEITGIRFRKAPEEFSLPASPFSVPQPRDGKCLALFGSKLVDAEKSAIPLRVIGVGSIDANRPGDAERLIRWVQGKYPKAPMIIYQEL